MMRRRSGRGFAVLALASLALASLAGCSAPPVHSEALLIGAPASLRAPFTEVASAFLARHPESPPRLVFGKAAELFQSGLTLDVIAADAEDGLTAFAGRLSPGDARAYASNPLVLVTRSGAPALRLATLPVTPWLDKLALADSRSVPSGRAAEAALGRLGIRRALNEKLLYLGAPDEVLRAIASGQAQAGLVFASELASAGDATAGSRLAIADRLPDDPHARYPVAILAATPRLTAARQFLDELLHGAGPAALTAAGLLPPGAPSAAP
jgi:molybdate transport system substrate-binding protein